MSRSHQERHDGAKTAPPLRHRTNTRTNQSPTQQSRSEEAVGGQTRAREGPGPSAALLNFRDTDPFKSNKTPTTQPPAPPHACADIQQRALPCGKCATTASSVPRSRMMAQGCQVSRHRGHSDLALPASPPPTVPHDSMYAAHRCEVIQSPA